MEIGIDSFAAADLGNGTGTVTSNADALNLLLERIEHADKAGLDVFGIGEHHRKEFLDSAPTMILAAAAALTKQIRLTSAVTVLSAVDPVRIFQNRTPNISPLIISPVRFSGATLKSYKKVRGVSCQE